MKTDRFKGNCGRALDGFVNFLQGCKPLPNFDHVMFACGTVIRMDNSDVVDPFRGFPYNNNYEFPIHRLSQKGDPKEDLENFMKENQKDFEWSQTLDYALLIAKAYTILIDGGYPYPGGQGGDRYQVPMSLNGKTMATIFPHRNVNILTITDVIPDDNARKYSQREMEHAHQQLGAEHRRLDYMFPQVYAVVLGTERTGTNEIKIVKFE